MWWHKPYINRRDWILENCSGLNLSSPQVMTLLMIDFLNDQSIDITLEILSERLGTEVSEVDQVIHTLVERRQLAIAIEGSILRFNLDPLFKNGVVYDYIDENIFEVFESEFGRLLSQSELMTLNKWLSIYSESDILDALRNALVYQKVSMNYINAILANKAKEQKYD